MKIVCITTMNKSYYDHLGKLMIELWSKFWPTDCELIVYQEDFTIDKFPRVKGISWEEFCLKDWTIFSKKIKTQEVNPRASVFAKKGYAMIAGMKNIDCNLLIWLDADIITKKFLPKEKIESLLSKNKLIGFFDTYYQVNPNYTFEEYINKERIPTAAESGFVIINKSHKYFNQYLKKYENLYNANTKPNTVGAWYDGNVCASAAIDLREHVEDFSNLRTTNKTQTPMNRSWLFEYMQHKKGGQKNKITADEIRTKLNIIERQ